MRGCRPARVSVSPGVEGFQHTYAALSPAACRCAWRGRREREGAYQPAGILAQALFGFAARSALGMSSQISPDWTSCRLSTRV